MRIPINWLKEYVDIKISVEKLSDKLTMSGTENEVLYGEKGSFEGIVVGEIKEIEKHPNADKLQVTKTSVGKESLQIVCGAPNIEVGQKVPVALVGAKIGEFEIKEVKIRGVRSHGMLCSEAELGISDDHTGIMILDPRAKAGDSLANALRFGDTVLEAEITPNRGDCLSMFGIAREVATVTGEKVRLPQIVIKEDPRKVSDVINVEVKNKNLCSRYVARVIENVKIAPSPKWMQERLNASGIRPINNVVDVTNYVMLEMGQPLHAFDADRVSSGKIIVRKAKRGEKIETLDGVERKLDVNDLVISDGKKAVALAGVMGGANSEVTESTKTVVLESANFHPTNIRKTALRLALRSESSSRFEKGLPLKLTAEAADRAAALLAEVAGGSILSGKVDVGVKKDKEKKVTLRFGKIKSMLGADIPRVKATAVLEALGFKIISECKEKAEFVVPDWRLDVSIEEDLLEEVARIYGYDKIPSTLPKGTLPRYEINKRVEISAKIRETLTAFGFFEVYSYSFTTKEKANMCAKNDVSLKVANPLSETQEYMRTDFLGSMLDIVSKNQDITDDIKVYEIAPVYKSKKEELKVGMLTSGSSESDAFHNAAGAVSFIVKNRYYKNTKGENSGLVYSNDKELGCFTILDSTKITSHKIKSRSICFIELDIETLGGLESQKKFSAIPKFPASTRDLTFIFDEKTKVSDIEQVIYSLSSKIRTKTEIVDIYRGKRLPKDKKSVSIRFIYQSSERTLTDKEVDDDQQKIIKEIKKSLGGELRGERE